MTNLLDTNDITSTGVISTPIYVRVRRSEIGTKASMWTQFLIWLGFRSPCCGAIFEEVTGWGRRDCTACGRHYKSF